MTSRVAPPGAAAVRPPRTARRPVQRHSGDLVRVVLGFAVLGLGLLIAQRGRLPVFERNLFQVVNDLPPEIFPVVWAVMQLGNVVAVPVLAAIAALTRRVRMARDMLISGVLAYLAADLVKSVVQRERPSGFPLDAHFPEGPVGGLGFVSGHSAVAAALATAVVPYVPGGGPRGGGGGGGGGGRARVVVRAPHPPV
ncbi:hypothetical protein ACI78Q_20840, partial [Geodermatophilus sp. SYSU D00705]